MQRGVDLEVDGAAAGDLVAQEGLDLGERDLVQGDLLAVDAAASSTTSTARRSSSRTSASSPPSPSPAASPAPGTASARRPPRPSSSPPSPPSPNPNAAPSSPRPSPCSASSSPTPPASTCASNNTAKNLAIPNCHQSPGRSRHRTKYTSGAGPPLAFGSEYPHAFATKRPPPAANIHITPRVNQSRAISTLATRT